MNDTRTIHSADALPVPQNTTYATPEEARSCRMGRIELRHHPDSGIVTNMAFDPSLVVHDARYQNKQTHSTVFRDHLEAVADTLAATMDCRRLVEVGCGKGRFLEVLWARAIDATGFDPAYEGSDPRVERKLLGGGTAMAASAVVLRHVLEHVQDPVGFLARIRDANGGQGRIYVEVPCFDWIRERRRWFDVFYEHVNYFRIRDFERMFGEVLHAGHCFGGQYLGVIAELGSLRAPNGAQRERRGRADKHAINVNPAKQGRRIPVTGLPAMLPQEFLRELPRGTRTLVMNSNHLGEIAALAEGRLELVAFDTDGDAQRAPGPGRERSAA